MVNHETHEFPKWLYSMVNVLFQAFATPIPVIDAINGTNEADNKHHIEARGALIQLLISDSTVTKHFQLWADRSGFTLRLGSVLRQIKVHVGAPDLISLCSDESIVVPGAQETIENDPYLWSLMNQAAEEVLAFQAGFVRIFKDESFLNELIADVNTLIHQELQLPYHWLPTWLIYCWGLATIGRTFDLDLKVGLHYVPYSPPAPPVSVGLPDIDGETITEQIARVEAYLAELKAQNAARKVLPKGRRRMPTRGGTAQNTNDSTTAITKWVEWYYRAEVKVKREPVRAIARSIANDREMDGVRRDVRDGISEAKRVLNLTPYRLHRERVQ